MPGGGSGVALWVMRSLQGNLCPAKEVCTAMMEVHLVPSGWLFSLSHCHGVHYDLVTMANSCTNMQTHTHTYTYIHTCTHMHTHVHTGTYTHAHRHTHVRILVQAGMYTSSAVHFYFYILKPPFSLPYPPLPQSHTR